MEEYETEILKRALQEWRDYDFLSEYLFQQLLKRLDRSTEPSFGKKTMGSWTKISFLPLKSECGKENRTKILRNALLGWKNDSLLSEDLFQQLSKSLYLFEKPSWTKKLITFMEHNEKICILLFLIILSINSLLIYPTTRRFIGELIFSIEEFIKLSLPFTALCLLGLIACQLKSLFPWLLFTLCFFLIVLFCI
ncbi:MAG: hypothetical protein LBR92_03820 [Puniceicoccales bacterium]|jgi:hypothetical protein|nr:hypothetical protein [Puniceicoccales bacterium]